MHRLVSVALVALVGCGDNLALGLDAPPPAPDAGVPEPPVDAAPPDAWITPPDAPSDEVCRYLPQEDFGQMANYPVRFGTGQGLEISPDIRQTGLLELENADVSKRDVVEKRPGAVQLGDSRSATPGDDIPDEDKRAIWARGDEILLETGDSLYRENRSISTYTWERVGSWIRARLREAYAGTFGVNSVLHANMAVFGDATVVAYQAGTAIPQFAVYGPSMSREFVETLPVATAVFPRLSSTEDFAVITAQDVAGARPLRARTWTPGDDSTALFATPFAAMPAAPVWDVHSVKTDTDADLVTAWMASAPTAVDPTLAINFGGFGGVTGGLAFGAAPAALADVSVSVWPRRVSGSVRTFVLYAFSNAGVWTLGHGWIDFDPTTGAVTANVSGVQALADAANQVFSVAASYMDRENVYIAVEQASGATRKVTYYTMARTAGFVATGIVHEFTSLVGQGAIVAGTPTDTLVSAGAAPLSPAFLEQPIGGDVLTRSGWFLYAPRTGEIVSRAFFGFTGDLTTRSTRPPKGSVIANNDTITWAGPAALPSEPGTNLRAIAVCKLDRSARANNPAQLDGTAISAHAGYPRAIDGTNPPFEHDWHSLPRITGTATNVAGGTTTAGAHFVAVTFERDDANGLRYRSAPAFEPGTLTSGGVVGNSAITVTIEPLTHTEATNVRAVVWMTRVGFPQYQRAAEAAITGASQTVTVSISDASLSDNEVLDQGPVPSSEGVVLSVPARVTDFVALLVDRLASRDPRVASVLTFTTPSREASGFAAHWYDDGVVQEALERPITSAIEMDGRVILGAADGFSQLLQDGPDATGQGTFGTPLIVRAPIGIVDHVLTERTPLGYVFGSEEGPRLLLPSLKVEEIDTAVERQYSIDGGELAGLLYDYLQEEIVFLDASTQTLRLNTHTNRWASDSDRLGRDITRRQDGTVYLLRDDGKVLRLDDSSYADGASGYPTTIAFRLRAPSRDGVAHGGFNFSGLEVFGEYLGSHAITVTVTLDFRDSTVILQGEVPAARVVQNAADGRDYRYAFYGESKYCYAARCEIELSSTTAQTARIDGIDVRYNVGTTGDPAQVQDEQRFALDVVG